MLVSRFALVVVVAALAAPAAADPAPAAPAGLKVAVTGLAAGAGVKADVAQALTDSFAASLGRVPGVAVTTPQQLSALLDLEAQKALAGCDDGGCMAQIASALGVDEIATGRVSRVGQSWLVNVKRVNAKDGSGKTAERRVQKGGVDGVLDALPGLVAELWGAPAASGSVVAPVATNTNATGTGTVAAAPAPGSAIPPPPLQNRITAIQQKLKTKPLPSGKQTVATVDKAVRDRLVVLEGKGLVVAYDPQAESFDPFYAGTGNDLFAQRVIGGGRDGTSFSTSFWEPRVQERWKASFEMKDGNHLMQCGDEKIALKPAKDQKAARARLRLHQVRWQRQLVIAARDDDGTYVFVDQAREPEGNRDYRVHIGEPGAFAHAAVTNPVVDDAGMILKSPLGTLKFYGGSGVYDDGQGPVGLVVLDTGNTAPAAYGQKTPIALRLFDEPLGTPCDGRL